MEAQRRADSTLRSLTNEDFHNGVARLERALMKDSAGDPVVDWLDLLVLRGRSLDRQAPDAYHVRASCFDETSPGSVFPRRARRGIDRRPFHFGRMRGEPQRKSACVWLLAPTLRTCGQ
jgi:hypothetical protein